MTNSLRRLFTCVVLLLALPLWAAEPVRIGVLAFRPKPQTLAQWQPLAAALKRQMPDRDFVIEPLDYLEVGEAVASRRIDFVLTNPGHYVFLAHRSGLSSPLATLVSEENGRPLYAYGGTIFTLAKRTDIRGLEDLTGRKVAVVTDDSLAGYQMQAYELAIRGIPLPHGSDLVKTGMPHDRAVEAVLNGQAEIGFARSGILEAMAREGKLDMAQLRILNRQDMPSLPWALSTRLYPEWPFAALPHIDGDLARNVAAVLFTLDRDKALMQRMKIHGFTVPADYTAISELLSELRLPPFDDIPRFTVADVLKKYRWESVIAMVLLSLIMMLAFRLLLGNRRLQSMQQLLAQSELQYRTTFNHAAVGIARISTEGRFLQINKVFCDIIGYTSEEVLSQQFTFQQITFAEDLAEDMAHVRSLLESDEDHYEMEKRYIRKDGRVVWVYLSVALLRDEAGRPLYFISSVIDIGERKQAERQLRKERDFAESLIDTAPTIILVLDAEGRIVRINPYMEALSGYTLSEVEGRDWFATFLPKATCEQTKALFMAAINDIQTHGNIDTIVIRSGQERTIEWYDKTLKDGEGNTLGLLAIGQDITERRKTENALQRSNADLERFAYSISHDMRQPLRAISGHMQLLARSLQDKLDEQERENLGFALDGAKRMDSMIVSLLDYSRVGRKTQAKKMMASRESLDEALGFLEPAIREADAQVSVGGVWPRIFASRDELTRLFQNLIGNALHYHEMNQSPRVEIESVVGENWRVTVRDHGIGIDPQQIDRLFQFFSRLQSRARYDGTGMGLALCRRIVEHHGGRIWAESEGEGKGSTFAFEMPFGQTGEAGSNEAAGRDDAV